MLALQRLELRQPKRAEQKISQAFPRHGNTLTCGVKPSLLLLEPRDFGELPSGTLEAKLKLRGVGNERERVWQRRGHGRPTYHAISRNGQSRNADDDATSALAPLRKLDASKQRGRGELTRLPKRGLQATIQSAADPKRKLVALLRSARFLARKK